MIPIKDKYKKSDTSNINYKIIANQIFADRATFLSFSSTSM